MKFHQLLLLGCHMKILCWSLLCRLLQFPKWDPLLQISWHLLNSSVYSTAIFVPGLFLFHLQWLNMREFLLFFFNSLVLLLCVIKFSSPDELIVTGLNLTQKEADGTYISFAIPKTPTAIVSSLCCYHLGCLQDRCCKLHCSSPDDFVAHGVVQSVVQSPRALASLYAPG